MARGVSFVLAGSASCWDRSCHAVLLPRVLYTICREQFQEKFERIVLQLGCLAVSRRVSGEEEYLI